MKQFVKKLLNNISATYYNLMCKILLKLNNVVIGESYLFRGLPYISNQGEIIIGNHFKMNNTIGSNPIGRNTKSVICCRKNASLVIGDNVGISFVAIIAEKNFYWK